MKVLIAVDGSEFTQKMLSYLAAHPEMFGPKHAYTLFTAQLPLPPHVRSSVGSEGVTSYYADEVEKVLAPAESYLKEQNIPAERSWKEGQAGETIAEFAESGKFDLIVMGSHGHGALGSLVMGSVATRVVAHSKVPVLLIR